jgi:hypothetical protein
MVRWYDWLAAALLADFILANAIVAVISPIWYVQLICVVSVWLLWDFWSNVYCNWRLHKENEY